MGVKVGVLVVGGGTGGLSAMLALGRARVTAVMLNAGNPRNVVAHHANGVFSRDHTPPDVLYKAARGDLERYETVKEVRARVTSVEPLGLGGPFKVTAVSEDKDATVLKYTAEKLILAMGVTDVLPDIPGMRENWGKLIAQCPFCHGFEVEGDRLGILMPPAGPVEQYVFMIRKWSKNLAVFTNGAEVSEEQAEVFEAAEIEVVYEPIACITSAGKDELEIELKTGKISTVNFLFAVSNATIPEDDESHLCNQLGLKRQAANKYLEVSPTFATSVAGVFAVGDLVTPMHSVIGAASSGYMAGCMAVHELAAKDLASVKESIKEGK